MSTLMSTGNSSGETGRCDAKCYGASGGVCHCCCGGRNHGVGLNQAIENTDKMSVDMIREWKLQHPDEHFIVENILF